MSNFAMAPDLTSMLSQNVGTGPGPFNLSPAQMFGPGAQAPQLSAGLNYGAAPAAAGQAGAGTAAAAGGGMFGPMAAFGFGMNMAQNLTEGLINLIRGREELKFSRRISRGLRREIRPALGELIGLPAVTAKGGFGEHPVSSQVAIAQALLRAAPQYSEGDIAKMRAAQSMLNPRFRSITGPATGTTLARSLVPPTRYWEEVLQPRMSALGANLAARQRGALAASAFRNARYRLAAEGYVK